MADNRFKKIDDLNESLEGALNLCITTLENLDLQGKTQEYVDKKCIKLSEIINSKLDFLRNDIIINLHQCYVEAQKQISQLGPIANANPVDLSGCINLVKKIANLYVKPYQEALTYYMELMPRIEQLIINISALATLPSYLPNIPNINYDKLNIQMPPVKTDNIVTGNLDAPEEPSPEKPRRQLNFRTYEDMYNQDKSVLKNNDRCIISYNIKGVNTKDGYRDMKDYFALVTEVYIYNNNSFELIPSSYPYFDSKEQFIELNKNKPSLKTSDEKTLQICIIDGQVMSLEKIYRTMIKKKLVIEDVDFAPCDVKYIDENIFSPSYVEVS